MKESTFPPVPWGPLALRAGAPTTSAPGGPDTGSRSAQRRRMVAAVRGRTACCGGSVSGRSAGAARPLGRAGRARRVRGEAGGPRTAARAEVLPPRGNPGAGMGARTARLCSRAPPFRSVALRYPLFGPTGLSSACWRGSQEVQPRSRS